MPSKFEHFDIIIINFSFWTLQIDYMAFSKNFYIEHEEISKLTSHEVQELRRKLALKVRSYVDSALMHLAKKINAHGYMHTCSTYA